MGLGISMGCRAASGGPQAPKRSFLYGAWVAGGNPNSGTINLTAGSSRRLVVAIKGARDAGGTVSPTWNGNAGGTAGGTLVGGSSISAGSLWMYRFDIPDAASNGYISPGWSITQVGCHFAAYQLDNLTSSSPAGTPLERATVSSNAITQTITTLPASSVCIATTQCNNARTFTWSGTAGLVEDYDNLSTNYSHSTASGATSSAISSATVISTSSSTYVSPYQIVAWWA